MNLSIPRGVCCQNRLGVSACAAEPWEGGVAAAVPHRAGHRVPQHGPGRHWGQHRLLAQPAGRETWGMAAGGQSWVICNIIIRKHTFFPERKSIELCTFPCNISSPRHQLQLAHSYTAINSLRVNGFPQRPMDLQHWNRAGARAMHM